MAGNPTLNVRIACNVDELKKNLAEGKAQIEALGPSVAKLASTWQTNSANLIQNARNITAAIDQIGASTLSAGDAAKNLRVLEQAMAQLRASGQPVPPLMKETATALQGVAGTGNTLVSTLSKVASTFGIAFGATAVIAGVKAMVSGVMDTASQVHDLAEKLDVSSEAVQRWSYAAKQTGTDMDTVQRSVAFMNKTLAGGDDSTVKALNDAHLQFQQIRAMKPEDAFNTIVAAIKNIPDPMTQARVAVELFGKAGQDMLPAIKEGFAKIGAEAYVMADGTINALEAAGDALDRFKNMATTRLGTAMGAAAMAFEEISKGTQGIKNWWAALNEAGFDDNKMVTALQKIRNAQNALTEDQKRLIEAEVNAGETNDLLAIGINASKDAINAYANSLRKATEDAKKAGQVHGATAEELAAANHKWEESAREAAARAKEFASAMEELDSVGDGWRGTLETIDGEVVEAIKYYLAAGVSQGKLATAYGLTDARVKAVASSMANELEITKKATEAAKVLSEIRNQIESGTLKLNEAMMQANANDQIAVKQKLELAAAMHMVEESIPPAVAGFHSLGMDSLANLGQRSTELEDLQVKLKGIAKPVDAVAVAVTGLATSFGQLGQQIGGTAGLALTAAAQMEQAFGAMMAAQYAAAQPGASPEAIRAGQQSRAAFGYAAVGTGASLIAQGIDSSGSAGNGAIITKGALQGAAAGAAMGSMVGPWGIAAGAGIGAIVGLVQAGKEWRQVVNDIGRDFAGIHVSDDFAKMIEDLEDSTGLGSAQAITTQLDQLIQMSGGLDSKNLTLFTQKLHDAFSYIETKTMSVAQVTQVLDKNFAAFAAAGTDSMGRLSDEIREIIRLNERFGTQSKEVAAYLQQQGMAAVTGFNAVVAGTKAAADGYAALAKAVADAVPGSDELTLALTAQHAAAEGATQALSDLGFQAVASFAAAVASGTSEAEALAAIHPALQALKQQYADLGMNVDNVALQNLMMQDTIIQANPTLVNAIQGLSGEMVALDNIGLLNVDTFGAMERTGYDMYVRLQASAAAAGGTTRDALLPMQGWLQEAATQAALLGIPLDANTQELVNQSVALGLWKEAGKSANDIFLDGLTKIVDKFSQVIDKLAGVTGAVNSIPKSISIDVVGTYIPPDIPDYGYGGPEWGGAMASGGDFMVTRPTLFLAGEAGPERATFSGGGKSGGGMSTAAMESELSEIRRLLSDQPRAMAIAVQDAVVLGRR